MVTTLEALRRRRKPIARTVVLLVSWVWLSASASPCLGMMSDTAEPLHVGSHHSEGAVSDEPSHSPAGHESHCPHCPPVPTAPGDEPASSHVNCSAADDRTNDSNRTPLQKWTVKYTSLAPVVDACGSLVGLPSALLLRTERGSCKSPPHLNLHYCVFLN